MEMEWEEGLEERNVLVLRGEEEAGKHGRREGQATAPTYRARDCLLDFVPPSSFLSNLRETLNSLLLMCYWPLLSIPM